MSQHDYPACAVFRGGKCTCDEGMDDMPTAAMIEAGQAALHEGAPLYNGHTVIRVWRAMQAAHGAPECFPLLDPNVPEGGSRYPDKGCYRVGCPVHGGPGGFPDAAATPQEEQGR